MGSPLKHLEQLLTLLPHDSQRFLPASLAKLVSSPKFSHYFPEEYEIDIPQKKNISTLEAIVLIPTVDEKLFQEIQHVHESHLTEAEKLRNKFGSTILCTFDATQRDVKNSPLPSFDDIIECNSKFEKKVLWSQ